jgi:membrane associated rhomboid family serine protease
MFMPLPLYVSDGRRGDTPWANGVLVALNVLAYSLGLSGALAVGPGSSWYTVLTYGFAHANVWHLLGNMFCLLAFGNPLNRRLGHRYYLLIYLGTLLVMGFFVRFVCDTSLMGASGAIFAVMAMCGFLLPSAQVGVGYVALFPSTLLLGLFAKPEHWASWFVRWDKFVLPARWCMVFVPVLEIWGLVWWGWNWTNLAHLLGLLCGVVAVLSLPTQITMKRPSNRSLVYQASSLV